MSSKNIAVFGLGYVGLSNAVLLAQHNHVIAVDINKERVAKVCAHESPIVDKEISEYLSTHELDLTATDDREIARNVDYVVVATPTNYDEETHYFDTSSVQSVIDFINSSESTKLPVIIVKSTIPIGFIKSQYDRGYTNVLFMPEFLREGQALYDNLHPSRIVIGEKGKRACEIASMYQEAALDKDVPVVMTGPNEAESVKLFANTYLAMRVAYFNELDTFAATHGYNSREIIDGMTLDPRIGTHYRNPSFGYGGYCLPKDTKQLLANCKDIPQNVIGAIVDSNVTRLDWVTNEVIRRNPKTVGFYRLIMKSGSDNFRASAMIQLLNRLKTKEGLNVVIYEPTWSDDLFEGVKVEHDLNTFKKGCDVVLANRVSDELSDIQSRVFSRDVYHMN